MRNAHPIGFFNDAGIVFEPLDGGGGLRTLDLASQPQWVTGLLGRIFQLSREVEAGRALGWALASDFEKMNEITNLLFNPVNYCPAKLEYNWLLS